LVGATLLILMLLILIPLHGSMEPGRVASWAVKDQQTTTTFNLAEGAVDRGLWKLKSATSTWAAAASGTVIPGYNLDVVYAGHRRGACTDSEFSSGPSSNQVTVFRGGERFAVGPGEGDSAGSYENRAFPGSACCPGAT
jgi:hypothetical protein